MVCGSIMGSELAAIADEYGIQPDAAFIMIEGALAALESDYLPVEVGDNWNGDFGEVMRVWVGDLGRCGNPNIAWENYSRLISEGYTQAMILDGVSIFASWLKGRGDSQASMTFERFLEKDSAGERFLRQAKGAVIAKPSGKLLKISVTCDVVEKEFVRWLNELLSDYPGNGEAHLCAQMPSQEILRAVLPVRVRAGDPHLTDAVKDFLDGRGEVCIRSVASR